MPVTAPEISRHPSELPRFADYRLYKDGTYQDLADRDGPMSHEIHFTSMQMVAEVMPGTTMELWTFDGRIPGPMIRARVGDSLDFFLRNDPASTMPHNVDFHAVTGPGGGALHLDTLPGSESELKVKLLNPGIYIYHCAFPDVPMHIAHGMYGLIVVEPEGGLPTVDHEAYVMQSELYTDRGGSLSAGALADAGHLLYSEAFANEERPTFVVFNGRPGAVAGDRAIGALGDPITTGQTMRLFVGNIGPNLVSSFHVIGEIFDTVYVEGSFDLVNRNVQSTVVPCGGAVGVEFRVEVPGTYLLVDHAIFRTHKGAAGELIVGGEADPGVFEPVKSDPIRTSAGH
jgi:nitrite reductase (NO-forming)